MPLRPLRAREIVRKLERAGFALRRQSGSHARYIHPDGRGVSIPEGAGHPKAFSSASAWASQKPMSISRYIVAAVVRCCWAFPPSPVRR